MRRDNDVYLRKHIVLKIIMIVCMCSLTSRVKFDAETYDDVFFVAESEFVQKVARKQGCHTCELLTKASGAKTLTSAGMLPSSERARSD